MHNIVVSCKLIADNDENTKIVIGSVKRSTFHLTTCLLRQSCARLRFYASVGKGWGRAYVSKDRAIWDHLPEDSYFYFDSEVSSFEPNAPCLDIRHS